jgi:hypothetical protein
MVGSGFGDYLTRATSACARAPEVTLQILDQHPGAVARERLGRGVGIATGDVRHDKGVDYRETVSRARTNNQAVGFLGHQCLSFSRPCIVQSTPVARSGAIAVPDPEIDWTMLLENELATLAREITSRHRVDRRSLLPLAPRRDAVARNAASRMAPRNRRCYSAERSKPRSVAVSAINAVTAS